MLKFECSCCGGNTIEEVAIGVVASYNVENAELCEDGTIRFDYAPESTLSGEPAECWLQCGECGKGVTTRDLMQSLTECKFKIGDTICLNGGEHIIEDFLSDGIAIVRDTETDYIKEIEYLEILAQNEE